MSDRLGRSSRILLVLALCGMLGAHWALVQAVAWSGMLINYSREAGLAVGISKTFDGKHPCPLCKSIQKERKKEQKQTPAAQVAKIDPSYLKPDASPGLIPDVRRHTWPSVVFFASVIPGEPLVPPPR